MTKEPAQEWSVNIPWHDLGGGLIFAVVVLLSVWLLRWLYLHFAPDGYWVYEIDTEDGGLLYIGSAADPRKRMRGHEAYQRRLPLGHPRKWWEDAAEEVQRTYWPSRATWYSSKEIAQAEEKRRIRVKNPIANQIRYKGVIPGGTD